MTMDNPSNTDADVVLELLNAIIDEHGVEDGDGGSDEQ
jgi:hypothetical protein